jgi:DNA ligase (NAD+)
MKIQIPDNCPCCEYPLIRVNDQLFCKNLSCSAQLNKKIEHFAKTLGIKGLGPKAVEKLNLADLTEIFYLDAQEVADRLGSQKIADKLLLEIEGAKRASLATVVASFSIPLIGNTAGNKLSKVVSNLDHLTAEKCKEAGLGDKATANFMDWYETEYQELKEFLPFTFNSQCSTISENAETVCITGKLSSFKTKALANIALTDAGYKVVENITKTTNYLVDEDNKNSSKRQKADEYGVVIITNLNDFIQKVKQND